MRMIGCVLLILIVGTGLNAEDARDWAIVPMLSYGHLSFNRQGIHSLGQGMLFTRGDMVPPLSERRDSLLIAGMFRQYFILEAQEGYPSLFHGINLMIDRRIGRHLFLGLVVAESDQPFYGGIRTFIAGPGYGFEFIRTENISLTLGIGLGVGYFGIELPNGESLSVMPIPIVRFNMETSLISVSFEFLTRPGLNITLLPQHRIRLVNSFGVNQFRDTRDLLFDITLTYRLFSDDSNLGDFAGIGIGVKNWALGFPLAENGRSYEVVYNAIYGLIDLSFLRISGGYLFNGMEIFDLNRRRDIGNGFFVNVTLAWQF